MTRFVCVVLAVLLSACTPLPLDPVLDDTGSPVDDTDDDTDGTPELVALSIVPEDPVVRVGEDIPFSARVHYDDGSYDTVTTSVEWTVDDERIATISTFGQATAAAAGATDIWVEHDSGLTGAVRLTVLEAEVSLTGLELRPETLELAVDDQHQFDAIASYSDGSTGNIAAQCTWNTDNRDVASVDTSGNVTARAEGNTLVTADCVEAEADATVTVVPADTPVQLPDLELGSLVASTSGDDITYTVLIRNTGAGKSAGFYVDFHLDSASAPDGSVIGDDWVWTNELLGGESKQVSVTLESVPPGTYSSWAIVDPEGYVEESDETDNTAGPAAVEIVAAPEGPNLEVTAFEGTTDGDFTYWTFTVKNTGDQVATSFWVDLFYDEFSAPDPCDLGDHFELVSELQPGASVELEHDVEDGPVLWWDSWLVVDICDSVEESDEADNSSTIELLPE